YGFGLHLEDLVDRALATPVFSALPRYPDVTRDVALIVTRDIETQKILSLIADARVDILQATSIFDVYQGPPIEPGKRSIGLRFRYRSLQRTLTEEEVNQVHDRLVAMLVDRTGARVRAD
ncbi:MAG: phenylalanine--tRNA ligase subunit beta, partial [Proteobacteria bacterium]|nr:phenylalanine--tRNA ligase subunit beta [Pseudomonadota bacterium]